MLAVAVRRFGIQLHAFCVLSNHFHLVVTDPGARLPAFEQYLDSLVARAVNSTLGRWESFWAPSSYSAVELLSPDDIVDKAAYTLANPVAAGLVRHGRDWPGLWSRPEQVGAGAMRVERPGVFFRAEGPMPETVELELVPPPGFESPAAFREKLEVALTEREQRVVVERREGREQQVGEREPTARPVTGESRRGLRPKVAGRDKKKRIEALKRLKDFMSAYREAWKAMHAGVRDVLFPHGTYWLRVAFGVRCAAPG